MLTSTDFLFYDVKIYHCVGFEYYCMWDHVRVNRYRYLFIHTTGMSHFRTTWGYTKGLTRIKIITVFNYLYYIPKYLLICNSWKVEMLTVFFLCLATDSYCYWKVRQGVVVTAKKIWHFEAVETHAWICIVESTCEAFLDDNLNLSITLCLKKR